MPNYLELMGRYEYPGIIYRKLPELENVPAAIPNEKVDRSKWPLRHDGTPKGYGWLGVLPNKRGGVSSEATAGVSIDGKEMEIPTMVPTLNKEEILYLLNQDELNAGMFKTPIGKSILQKAINFAVERLKQGLSPFKEEVDNQGGE